MTVKLVYTFVTQIKSTKPENFTPKITEKADDYVRVEYESPIMGVSVKQFLSFLYFHIDMLVNKTIRKLHAFEFNYIESKTYECILQLSQLI